VRAVPRLCKFYPGMCLTTEEKARKNLSQGKKNLSQSTVHILPKQSHITKPTHTHTHSLLGRKQRMIIVGSKITMRYVSRFLNYETIRYVDKLQNFQQEVEILNLLDTNRPNVCYTDLKTWVLRTQHLGRTNKRLSGAPPLFALQPKPSLGRLNVDVSTAHTIKTHTRPVGLLCMNDQLVAETAAYTTHNTNIHVLTGN
jgi:hypothetical protein